MTTIIGGGLAGLCLALELVERGVEASSIRVVDRDDEHRGSATPATMLHAFPGRRLSFRRGQDDAFVRSWAKLIEWKDEFDGGWMCQAPMVRPLTEDDRGKKLRRTWEENRAEYPDLLESGEMSAEQVSEKFPELHPSVPCVVYGPAAGVMLPRLVKLLKEKAQGLGVEFVDGEVVSLTLGEHRAGSPKCGQAGRGPRGGEGWTLGLDDGRVVSSQQVTLAVGPAMADFFEGLDLRKRAGELALFDPGEATLTPLLGARKHIFERPDGLWGLGSTYFSVDEWEDRDDEYVVERLKAGVRDVLPAIDDAELVELWRGVRGVFGSDHMPLVGPVPQKSGLYSFAAFGSKGLLWIPGAAQAMARFLVDGDDEALNPHMDSRRMSADKWALG